MRYLSNGVGQMMQFMVLDKTHTIMHNSALAPCPKCMTLQDNILRLNMAEETKVIHGYIANPHDAYWRIRDQMDADQAAFEQRVREAQMWKQDFMTHRKQARQIKQEAAEALLSQIHLPPNVTPIKSKKSS